MIRISELNIAIGKDNNLAAEIESQFSLSKGTITSVKIIKKSIDARKKDQIHYSFTVDISINKNDENRLVKKYKNISFAPLEHAYTVKKVSTSKSRPIIIGMGPAGLLCALNLAKAGLKPIVIERGQDVDSRSKTVSDFWKGESLNTESNVQFGEGGAGTFSDGKLNTGVKDKLGYKDYSLKVFVENGAPEAILYDSKPHIGTDILVNVVKNIRNQIIENGGSVLFNTKLIDIDYDNSIKSIKILDEDKNIKELECKDLIIAIGHSARDTFEMLNKHISMEPKPFAIGYRVIHKQDLINKSQYGENYADIYEDMPASPYKVTYNSASGRGVYSFCMCPGGYVVNASSEDNKLCVNGMSYSDRASDYANSAIIVQVTPEDFPDNHSLAGMYLQRDLEEAAYNLANGKIPVEDYISFSSKENELNSNASIDPNRAIKGLWEYAPLHTIMPDYINVPFIEGMEYFDTKVKGFATSNPLVAGIETRTSSPIRMIRDEGLESNIKGIYPCGEGAGYAGGIISAAMDGVRVAEQIINKYI